MTRATYYLLDVFTDSKYGGNPLAIFPDSRNIDPQEMQSIASELNLSETVFLYPKTKDGVFPMRIFTPKSELPTAGHPSIGAGFFLSRESTTVGNQPIEIVLQQKVGNIKVDVTHRHNVPNMATMYQILPTFGKTIEGRRAICDLLSLKEEDLLPFPIQVVSCGVPYILVPVETLAAVEKIQFKLEKWQELSSALDGFSIYAFTTETVNASSDLHGRMFAPDIGILEDPATGSANGPLACYCLEYGIKSGLLVSEQGFEMGRPSLLHIEARKEEGKFKEVKVAGKSVFVGKGEFFLD